MMEITAMEQRMKRNEDSLRDLWNNIKHNNMHIIGVLEVEEREKGSEKISEEITSENYPNMGKEIVTQVQEAQRNPARINPRGNMPRHTVIKLAKIKDKEKILKATREKQHLTYKGILLIYIRYISWFFSRNSAGQEGLTGNIESDESEKLATKNTLPSKALTQISQRNKMLWRQAKAKRIQHH